MADRAAADAEKLLLNARRALRRAQIRAAQLTAAGGHHPAAGRRRGRLRRAVDDLTTLLAEKAEHVGIAIARAAVLSQRDGC